MPAPVVCIAATLVCCASRLGAPPELGARKMPPYFLLATVAAGAAAGAAGALVAAGAAAGAAAFPGAQAARLTTPVAAPAAAAPRTKDRRVRRRCVHPHRCSFIALLPLFFRLS